MDYQELISSYNSKSLDINSLKEKLEIAKPLKGRPKYRAIDIISQRSVLLKDINNALIISETLDKTEVFYNTTKNILYGYFEILINSMKKAKAWKFMKMLPQEYTIEKFENLNRKEQYKLIFNLNREYIKFLEYQNIADIRDCLRNANTLNDEIIRKLKFLIVMFNGLKNKEAKIEFFCFDKSFLMTLIEFRKRKNIKLDDYIKTKKKNVQEEYKKLLNFFNFEDFRDISENLKLTSKTLRTSVSNVIEAFSELSESEAESYYIKEEFKQLKQLEDKYKRMYEIKPEKEKDDSKKTKYTVIKRNVKSRNQINSEDGEKEQKVDYKEQIDKNIKKEKIKTVNKNSNKEIKNKKEQDNIKEKTNNEKEIVRPLIFSWFDKNDVTIARTIGSKKLEEFFNKIKEIQNDSNVRVSLYMVTNAGKEIALKRLKDLKKKANQSGLPNLVNGVLGGYGSFRITEDEKITDIEKMVTSIRKKIITTIEKDENVNLSKYLIDDEEKLYIRYQIENKKDNIVNKNQLNSIVKKLLKNERLKELPLKILPFNEKKYSGIDILLESQIKEISQLSNYYKENYIVVSERVLKVRIDNIEQFIK